MSVLLKRKNPKNEDNKQQNEPNELNGNKAAPNTHTYTHTNRD